jgi:hypothetical protein
MTLRKTSLALATVGAALAGASAFGSVSAQRAAAAGGVAGSSMVGGGEGGGSQEAQLSRAPKPSQTLPGATSRSNRSDMHMAPIGRGTRGGMGRR